MKGFMIRGQGTGIRADKFFLRPPTEAEMDEALADELLKHGLKPTGDPHEKLWVQVQAVDVVGEPSDAGKHEQAPTGEGTRVHGKLDAKKLKAMKAARAAAPPGSAKAAENTMVTSGTAMVINPGDVAEVPAGVIAIAKG